MPKFTAVSDPNSSRRRFLKGAPTLAAACLLLLGLYCLLDTRIGVLLVFDVFGDIRGTDNVDTDPASSLLRLDAVLPLAEEYVLPEAVEQASGIAFDHKNKRFLVSTDQAELFELDEGFALQSESRLLGGPRLLRQGKIEGIDLLRDGRLLAAGELSSPPILQAQVSGEEKARAWAVVGNAYFEGLVGPNADREWTGVAVDHESDKVYLCDGESQTISVLQASVQGLATAPQGRAQDLEFALVRRFAVQPRPVEPPEADEVLPGKHRLLFSGLSYAKGKLYILSESYGVLLEVDPENEEIERVFGLSGVGEGSDLVVVEDLVYVTIDHNLFDPRPPIRTYRLPSPKPSL